MMIFGLERGKTAIWFSLITRVIEFLLAVWETTAVSTEHDLNRRGSSRKINHSVTPPDTTETSPRLVKSS